MIVAALPRSAALLASSTLLQLASSHALPRETKTISVRELNVVAWPIVATTPAPKAPSPALASSPADQLLQRDFNTICGWIGGDASLPATCLAGSHCAADTVNKAIGCCPDSGPCTEGIFTGCVDVNSPPQTELNPYVFTCSGAQVCYLNHFEGGFSQFGCGSVSQLATTVAATALSQLPLDLSRVSVHLTETPTVLSTPTTIGSRTASRTSSRRKSRTTSGSSTSQTDTSTNTGTATASDSTSTSTSTSTPSAPTSSGSSKAGPIAGGVVGGLAGLALIAALIFFFLRKRKARPAQYITPSTEKFDNPDSRAIPPNTALLTEERGFTGYESELAPMPQRPPRPSASEPAPQLGELGLAVPMDTGYGRPSDEIPLTETAPKPPPEPVGEDEEDPRPYNPRRRGDGDGTSFWSQTRSESRSRGRPWV
ncbi:hypothetical protein TRIATDRAFT_314453 [Trichoderma atroviride IMI 206040]|uniref:Mid2 domain-containing protein n=2 Tax=Hypocrea atroviridis TaxID=63577 RepID=G9NG38_HYPAI|nr:uncharacterized protein TRIATDRAFT_314453 [Trichoderma atroviride IMI 206040]EHK50250.1 hypothetical protein TRIATDRAFT_314453 [Trichoderma atroviride IMI 206040]